MVFRPFWVNMKDYSEKWFKIRGVGTPKNHFPKEKNDVPTMLG